MEACSSFFLPRVVGIGKASEWVLTGRIFKAKDVSILLKSPIDHLVGG
jgi:hypothetical protein